MNKYDITIGLEVHAQVSSKTKLFCSCSNDSFGKDPNINMCKVCMGFPGTLPVLNEYAMYKASIATIALGCKLKPFSVFDRKNYFYPDLTKGYQITQMDFPLGKGGVVKIKVDNNIKEIRVNRLHVEEDAGKLTHIENGSLCDYNRAGSPLMEIVSEPDITSVEEATAYAKMIRKILRYADVSYCDMEKGMMRFDANISLKLKGADILGNKVEIKNLNSFKSLELAINYEIKRQAKLLDNNEKVMQETRGWVDDKMITIGQRSKEISNDYRYFPEPDLPPYQLDKEKIQAIKDALPEMPYEIEDRFINEYKLNEDEVCVLLNDVELTKLFDTCVIKTKDIKNSFLFVVNILAKHLNENKISFRNSLINQNHIITLIEAVKSSFVSKNIAKNELFNEMFETGEMPIDIIKKRGYENNTNADELKIICETIIKDNPSIVEKYRSGNQNVLGFLIGQAMRKTEGKSDPKVINDIIKKLLN